MATPLRKSLSELKNEARELLEASGVITNLSEGGVARSLLDITASQIASFYDALSFHESMGRLSTSSGVFLDILGQSRGITRGISIAAIITQDDETIKFYSNDGRTPIKTLLTGSKVASGTTVSSSDGNVVFEVSEDVYPDDVQVEVFVPVISQSTGASQNVGKGVLNAHNLGIGGVSVTNVQAISTGQDTESDDNYRFRISRTLAQAAGATEDSIRLAALSFPGIADVQLRPFSDGVGTFEVIVTPVGNRLPSATLRGVEAVVRRIAAFGSRVRVKTPVELPVQLTIQLEFRKEARTTDKSRIKEQVRRAILNYLGEISVGGTLVLGGLTQRVMDVSDTIFDMKVLLFRFRSENHVLRNVQAEPDELFVPDQTAQNPIKVI